MTVFISIIAGLCVATLVYVVVAGYGGLIRLIVSLMRMAGYAETLHNSPHQRQPSDDAIPVSLILPDCDDDPQAAATVGALLALEYPEYEVIAVCNGEGGQALGRLVQAFDMLQVQQPIRKVLPMREVRAVYRSASQPSLVVLDMAGGLHGDALNAGVNVSRYPVFVTLPAGGALARNHLEKVAAPFALSHTVVALGGLPRVRGTKRHPRGALGWLQQAEFLRSYPADFAIPENGRLRLIPGAYGAFRKTAVLAEGGFAPGCGETEMVARLYRQLADQGKPHHIDLLPEPIAHDPALRRPAGFFRARRRRQAALVQALWRNRGMTLNPKYGRAGTLDMPYYWFYDVLGPILEVLGCILVPLAFALGWVGADLLWAFLATEVLLGMVVSLAALMAQELIESDRPSLPRLGRLVLAAILGNIGYRQVVQLLRIAGTFSAGGRKA